MTPPATPAAYIASVADPAFAAALRKIHAEIVAALTARDVPYEECISYAMPGFRHTPGGARGKVIAGYAAHKNICGLYPHSGNILPGLGALIGPRGHTKSALHFTPDDPIPADLLHAMIDARLAEIAKA